MPDSDDEHRRRPRPPREERPEYTRYRASPRIFGRGNDPGVSPLDAVRREREGAALGPGDSHQPSPSPAPRGRRRRRRLPRAPIGTRWVLKKLGLAALAWIALSVLAFVISATLHQSSFDGASLDGSGTPPFSATTILVLGSDARPKGSKEPGANTGGPSRADTIMLLRLGGGHNSKLSIPRDTVVPIPGHGQQKINAAYAFGGTSLMVDTLRGYLGLGIDHVVEIDFENFPKLIDAMGGIDYKGSCVVARINGGARNGGVTLRLKAGKTHIDGKHALALARVRKNDCNKRENDLSRARRQQKLLGAMKSRVLSIHGFVKGPFIGWRAPQAIKSDMAGPTLLGVFAALATSGAASPHVLKPSGAITLSDGGAGLTVSEASKRAAVRRLLG